MAFFFIIASAGSLIRYHFIHTIENFNYSHWVHMHSHVAFLGWVFMGLIGLLNFYFEEDPLFPHDKFRFAARALLVINLGMMISFPIQGYGPVSISFSVFHMLAGLYVFLLYLPYFRKMQNLGAKLIKWGFIWMLLSGLGPLALGPLVMMNLKGTFWYDAAIYYYLHFQYNGFFTLVILGLIIFYLEQKRTLYLNRIQTAILLGINLSVVLTYFLSILSIEPPMVFYLLGGLGAVIQIVIILFIVISVLRQFDIFLSPTRPTINIFLIVALAALEMKLYLQFFSGIPTIAEWVFFSRNTIIAYLHLVLLGFVSSFMLGWWYKITGLQDTLLYKFGAVYYFIGFLGIESVLLLYVLKLLSDFELVYLLLFIFSACISLGILLIGWDMSRKKKTQYQIGL